MPTEQLAVAFDETKLLRELSLLEDYFEIEKPSSSNYSDLTKRILCCSKFTPILNEFYKQLKSPKSELILDNITNIINEEEIQPLLCELTDELNLKSRDETKDLRISVLAAIMYELDTRSENRHL